jgi:ABC-type transporter Mla MlaB component
MYSHSGTSLKILIKGTFTILDKLKFNEIKCNIPQSLEICSLDLSNVNFVDSYGIGMIFLLHEICIRQHISLQIKAKTDYLKESFHLFNIEEAIRVDWIS